MRPPSERQIQIECVSWFRMRYPEASRVFFAVPNGGARNPWTAKNLRDEGALSGVADLILLVPKWVKAKDDEGWQNLFHGLCIEMKTDKGRQSPEQKAWQKKVEEFGYRYAVCHSLDEFINTINDYLT